MRRADRLFQIIQYLRGRRLTTARWLADKLEVSERTIYRDIADLVTSGVPIDGEAGVGYILRRGFDMPPLMFSRDELEALVLGARMVSAWAGTELARSAEQVLSKVEAVLPDERKGEAAAARLFVPGFMNSEELALRMDILRGAINQRRLIRLQYSDAKMQQSERIVRPLGLFFWGRVWTMVAWCEMRDDFRSFRIDRIAEVEVMEQHFNEQEGMSLGDFLSMMKAELENAGGVWQGDVNF